MTAARKLLALLLVTPILVAAQASRITTVEPPSCKHGDTASANGEGIDKSKVEEIYLTDGKVDILLKIVEQTDKFIKFTVPSSAKPGRWALMIKTRGADARLLEQPVKLTVEQ